MVSLKFGAADIFDALQIIGSVGAHEIGQLLIVLCLQIDVERDGGIGPAAQVQHIAVRAAIDIVAKVGAGDEEGVIARAAEAVVLERAAIDRVGSAVAAQRVNASPALQHIVEGVSGDRVVARAANDILKVGNDVSVAACDTQNDRSRASQRHTYAVSRAQRGIIQRVDASAAVERVSAVRCRGGNNPVAACAAE